MYAHVHLAILGIMAYIATWYVHYTYNVDILFSIQLPSYVL